MAMSVSSVVASCSVCGEPLNKRGECLACLLRAALDKSVVEGASPNSVVFGDFEIARCEDGSLWELGRGAMGVTYLAVDKVLHRKVALKVIEVPVTMHRLHELHQRFLREARSAASLRHPNVAAVYQFGSLPDGHHRYYAMELVEGETLETRVRRDGPLNARLVLEIAIQIARALMAAAAHGLIHRDLKPGNIMLAPTDSAELEVKVIDFGLAKAISDAENEMDLTHGEFVGTPNFASPEQFQSGPVDVRSDIYSLGATLWFALTGKTPFPGRNVEEIHRAQQSNPLPIEQLKAARVPSRFRLLLRSMLAIEPARRPSVHDLTASLRRYSAHTKGVRGIRAVTAIAAAVVILAVSAFLIFPLPHAHRAAGGAKTEVPEKSIAVLPFENATTDPNAEYLSEGISEALINSLTELQRLRVVARSTAFQYKGKNLDPRRVGRELQVAAVLTGRVRQAQDALSIQVDLVDAVTGAQLWGEEYHRKISDVIAVKRAIAQEVTEKLKLKLSGEEQRRLAKNESTNTEAYRSYLRGRYFWNKRTPDGIKQAIVEFQQAIERDPQFALGYVGLADCYTGLAFYNFAAPREAMPKAKESAIQALSLDNTVAEAHATLAHVLMNYDWDWASSEKEFKRSIELKPDYATAHQWYAIHYLTATSRFGESVQEMKRALELEPASLVMNTFMGATLYYAGRYDEAIDQCRRTVEMDPNFAVAHWHLGLAYEQKQVFDGAIEEFRKAISLSQGSPLMRAALGHAYAKAQKTYEANKILNELSELSKQEYVSPLEISAIYVALGNNEKAFELLEKAYADRSFHLVNLNVSPRFESVRSNQRFQDLVQRIGLSR
jgi:eukaryotic-like serine/threonine-protein kinase